MNNDPKETHVVSPDARIRKEKENRPLLQLIQRQRLTDKNPSTDKTTENRVLGQEDADSRVEKKSQPPTCNYWYPPLCQSYKSETGYNHDNKCRSTKDQRKMIGKDQLSC